MLFVAVTHLEEGVSLETLLTCGKDPNLLSGNTDKRIHNTTIVDLVLENVHKNSIIEMVSFGIKYSEI
jgi:hypothetical protein